MIFRRYQSAVSDPISRAVLGVLATVLGVLATVLGVLATVLGVLAAVLGFSGCSFPCS